MPPRTRMIRREPLISRIKAYFDPWDFLLWLSEELNSNDWDESWNQWATPTGIILNVIFMIARSNSANASSDSGHEVFADYHERRGGGWLVWFASFVVHLSTLLSLVNAFYTFYRRRHYRLFEASIDTEPLAPSARRVRVDSSPVSSSPLRYLSSILSATTAQSRAHPDPVLDVWELAVWDPPPPCLRLFCVFSPGHILVYWLLLPVQPLDPRPSVTVATTVTLSTLLSCQLLVLQTFYSRQAKDTSLIHKEVQHEYDSKFVHPSLHKPVRDVGTQVLSSRISASTSEVKTYNPATYVNRGFQTNPNPNYTTHFDPDGASHPKIFQHRPSRVVTTPNLYSSGAVADSSSPLRYGTPSHQPQVQQRPSTTRSASGGDGGSFGIYSHAHSPLKKTTGPINPANSRASDPTRHASHIRREGSPLKTSSTPGGLFSNGAPPKPRHSHPR